LLLIWLSLAVVVLLGGCVDIVGAKDQDVGPGDSDVSFDVSPDFSADSGNVGNDLHSPEDLVLPPFCDLMSSPIPAVHVDQDFVYPAPVGFTRDIAGSDWTQDWLDGLGGISTNLILVLGDEGRERVISGIWLPFGSALHFRLGDHFPHYNPPEIVPEYMAVSVLVDHKKVMADYEWEWKGRDYDTRSFFMSVPHQTTQLVDVKIPASAFPEARAYDVVVLFFKPNVMVTQIVQMFRMTLYYGGFDVPEHPCTPIAEKPELTAEEEAYEQRTDWLTHRNRISLFREHPAESTEKTSVLEVDKDATNVQLNVLFRGTTNENYEHEHVPMKIITFVDYVAQEDSILIGLPRDTRDFVHRDKVEILLNPGPETIVWMVGIYNPWIPAVSWDNRVNPDIPGLYWAYRSNRIILRRSE